MNVLMASTKTSRNAVNRPGRLSGSVTRVKTLNFLAPSEPAASSSWRLSRPKPEITRQRMA